MGKLLKLEWLKIRKYRALMVLAVLGVISIFGINYIVYDIIQSAGEENSDVNIVGFLVGEPFEFPQVWHTASYLGGFLLFVSGLMIILLMANEYSFRTARQNVIDGVSRTAFIDTKIAMIVIAALAFTLFVFLAGLLFGLTGEGAFSLSGMEYLGYSFIKALGYMSIALVIVMLLKRSGVSIGIYFLYVFIIENLVGLTMNRFIAKGAGNFLPLRSSGKLIRIPGAAGEFMETDIAPVYLIIAAVAWIAVCLLFCRYRFKKSDL